MQYAPTRVHEKPARFHISAHGYTKNAPDFIHPNKDAPKTRPVLGANLRRGYLRGVCNAPLHGYMKNPAGFIFPHTDAPKTRPVSSFSIGMHRNPALFYTQTVGEFFSGRMQYAPTRIRAKPVRFHISPPEYTKNAPDFTLPNRDAPKTRPVLHPNLRRRTFWGICNTPLHGYVQNLAGFIFPHTDAPKTHPILPPPIRIRPKPARF